MGGYTETGRSAQVIAALAELGHEPVRLVEIGTLRNTSDAARVSDGWITLTLAEHIRAFGGTVETWDIRNCAPQVRSVCGDGVEVYTHDARDWYDTKAGRAVDLLVMDGPNDSLFHLSVYWRIRDIVDVRFVLFDDVVYDEYGPKATDTVRDITENGGRIVWHLDRMMLLEAP